MNPHIKERVIDFLFWEYHLDLRQPIGQMIFREPSCFHELLRFIFGRYFNP